MDIEPEIKEDGVPEEAMEDVKVEGEGEAKVEAEGEKEGEMSDKYVEEIRIGDETIFTLPFDMQ